MREPAAKLHRPIEALRRINDLIGRAKADYWNDRAPDRAERIIASLVEAQMIAEAALNGGPLPVPSKGCYS